MLTKAYLSTGDKIMPFCPKCGKEISAEASYCSSCGANLRVDKDLLREKIAEARHNEIGALVFMATGSVIAFIGFIMLFIPLKRYEWRGLTLYEVTYFPLEDIGIILMVLSLIVLVPSVIVGLYYYDQRSKLMKQLESLK